MAIWIVPRNNSDMKVNGGEVQGDTSVQAVKDAQAQVFVTNAVANSVLYVGGVQVSAQKTAGAGGYQWTLTEKELDDAYDATSGENHVEFECKNTNASPNLLINTENHYTLLPD